MGSIIKGIDRDVRFVEIEILMNFEKVGPVLHLIGAENVSHDNVCRIDIYKYLKFCLRIIWNGSSLAPLTLEK